MAATATRSGLNPLDGMVDAMKTLLIVHHSPTPSVQALTEAAVAGSRDEAIHGVEVVLRPALEATATDVLGSDGYLLVTPANFGYMSGALKHFFDSIFLEAGGSLADDGAASAATGAKKPYGLMVHGRYDTTGAVRSVQSIVGALSWRQSAEVVQVLGDVDGAALATAYELGGTLAAILMDADPDAEPVSSR